MQKKQSVTVGLMDQQTDTVTYRSRAHDKNGEEGAGMERKEINRDP